MLVETIIKDSLWRLQDIKAMLLTKDFLGNSLYGLDEWSTPIVNINSLIRNLEKIQSEK